jgi:hypothetical protein
VQALEASGGANAIANGVVSIGNKMGGDIYLLGAVYIATMLLSQVEKRPQLMFFLTISGAWSASVSVTHIMRLADILSMAHIRREGHGWNDGLEGGWRGILRLHILHMSLEYMPMMMGPLTETRNAFAQIPIFPQSLVVEGDRPARWNA